MTDVRAELMASVFKIDVTAGERVEDGDVLLVLESMKMEIPVLSTVSGEITEILVSEGEMVEDGMILVRVIP